MRFPHLYLYRLLILAGGLAAVYSQAADYTLSHAGAGALNKPTSIDINTVTGAGVYNWNAAGVSQLNYHWFYYRVGAVGPEAPIENIDNTPTVVYTPAARALDLTYDNGSYSVQTSFQLTGGNTPNLSEIITIHNHSGANLDFHFFQYSDFDLFGSSGGQSVEFSTNSVTGQYYKAIQTDGTHTITEKVNTATPPIGHYEAQFANATLNSLLDGGPTTLSDTTSAGVGNVTFAYQWDVNMANGTSFQLSKLLTIVPEPTALSLVIVTIATMHMARRKEKKP